MLPRRQPRFGPLLPDNFSRQKLHAGCRAGDAGIDVVPDQHRRLMPVRQALAAEVALRDLESSAVRRGSQLEKGQAAPVAAGAEDMIAVDDRRAAVSDAISDLRVAPEQLAVASGNPGETVAHYHHILADAGGLADDGCAVLRRVALGQAALPDDVASLLVQRHDRRPLAA